MKIYHNPRCSKSRQGLQILKDSHVDFEVVEYLKTPLTFDELKEIIRLLDIKPIELVRKNEAIWKDNFKGKDLSDNAILQAMADFPKLIERPIVINKGQAVVGRPPQIIKSIL